MTTKNKSKISSFLALFIVLALYYPISASAVHTSTHPEHQKVFEICSCKFPAEVGAFKYLEAIKARYTLLTPDPESSSMVQEIFAKRKGKLYRILTLVASTETSSVGKNGPVIEIVKWNGPYWPGTIIYQLSPEQIKMADLSLKNE